MLVQADLPALLPALAHATGDLGLLRRDLMIDALLLGEPQAGLTPEQQDQIRELAFRTLAGLRDNPTADTATPDAATIERLMEFCVGQPGMAAYVPLMEEELAIVGDDPRAPGWTLADIAPGRSMNVLIVGAGMSGLLAAFRLGQAGIPFTIIEKNDDVGGTWWENSYPGCRVDNPNHLYSYSFAQKHDWQFNFSTRGALHDYFREFADTNDLRRHVRFGTEVIEATWFEGAGEWAVDIRSADGTEDTLRATAVISAVGQLNRPKYPDIEGWDHFTGQFFHSARWEHDIDLVGKRVAVIGTGASAAQFIPIIAEQVDSLTVYQRTPNWLGPTPDYHEVVADGQRWLYDHVPHYSQWHRFLMFWRLGDNALVFARVDPEWPDTTESVSVENAMMRDILTQYLAEQFDGRPDLLAKAVPGYPVTAKRVLRDNGVWASALKRPNVDVITEPIQRITRHGIIAADGIDRPVDVIIYGTGFHASKFLTPMRVVGRDGVEIHDQWDGNARAYLGVTVPNFPNFFCLYGPNTNIVLNGSIIYFSECEVRYVVDCLRHLAASGTRALDVRGDVHDSFNESIDAENLRMTWGVSTVNSWYKSESGRVAQNWPFSLLEYWERTRAMDPNDYHVL